MRRLVLGLLLAATAVVPAGVAQAVTGYGGLAVKSVSVSGTDVDTATPGLQVNVGSMVTVTATGFCFGGKVTFTFSPASVGPFVVNANNVGSASVTVSPPQGVYTVTATGDAAEGTNCGGSGSDTFTVQTVASAGPVPIAPVVGSGSVGAVPANTGSGAAGAGLPVTGGSEPFSKIQLSAVAVLAGIALLVVARVRRRDRGVRVI